ncbi:hypothetical protein KM043_001007 [Ampulex compressa]|nr:hypothetical protein KM043_001007 [Ampulex compressa]
MFLGRRVLCPLLRRPLDFYVQPRPTDQRPNLPTILSACKLSTYHITKNIELLTEGNRTVDHGNTVENLDSHTDRPLLVILSWLLSKRRHVMKFVNLYMEQGFDVAMVTITPWQLMWPTKGSRLVAADLLTFLAQNTSYRQILLHGFSNRRADMG